MSREKPPKAGQCPICSKPVEQAFRPFCSKRCADVDLAHWLGGDYRIQTNLTDDDEEGLPSTLSPQADGSDRPH